MSTETMISAEALRAALRVRAEQCRIIAEATDTIPHVKRTAEAALAAYEASITDIDWLVAAQNHERRAS